MFSTVQTRSTIKPVPGLAASIIEISTGSDRTINTTGDVVDRTDNDSSVAIVNGEDGNFAVPNYANRASLKDDFEASSSHWFLNSEVSSLLLMVKSKTFSQMCFDTISTSYGSIDCLLLCVVTSYFDQT